MEDRGWVPNYGRASGRNLAGPLVDVSLVANLRAEARPAQQTKLSAPRWRAEIRSAVNHLQRESTKLGRTDMRLAGNSRCSARERALSERMEAGFPPACQVGFILAKGDQPGGTSPLPALRHSLSGLIRVNPGIEMSQESADENPEDEKEDNFRTPCALFADHIASAFARIRRDKATKGGSGNWVANIGTCGRAADALAPGRTSFQEKRGHKKLSSQPVWAIMRP